MGYSFLIDDMEWSYSRITSFADCRYGWFLKYLNDSPSVKNFYSEYGTFMHHILQKYLKGELKESDLSSYYICNFATNVTMRPQKSSTYLDYFKDGLDYLSGLKWRATSILGVEREVHYKIGDKPARGFIDLEESDGGIIITDHKSAKLKPRSNRKKPTANDVHIDEMFRQLYLYSLPIKDDYGEYPRLLRFNTFRTGGFIEEVFDLDTLHRTEDWAIAEIEKITNNDDWSANVDFFRCRFLCDQRYNCEYFEAYGR